MQSTFAEYNIVGWYLVPKWSLLLNCLAYLNFQYFWTKCVLVTCLVFESWTWKLKKTNGRNATLLTEHMTWQKPTLDYWWLVSDAWWGQVRFCGWMKVISSVKRLLVDGRAWQAKWTDAVLQFLLALGGWRNDLAYISVCLPICSYPFWIAAGSPSRHSGP